MITVATYGEERERERGSGKKGSEVVMVVVVNDSNGGSCGDSERVVIYPDVL